MTAHTQPIALPTIQHNDYRMHDPGSFNNSDQGTFNPASFTRHFIGSPISWRAGSFGMTGSRFPAGSPTAHLLSTLECNKIPSDRDSIMNALSVFDREGEFCRNYTCCGLHLNDLHALLEHFEDVHIIVLDPTSPQPQAHIQIPFNPTVHDLPQQQQQPQQYSNPFDPDDMELDIDLDNSPPQQFPTHSSPSSGAPSPPDTPISTPLSAYPSPHAFVSHPYVSQPPSPLSTTAASTRQNSPTLPNYHPHRQLAAGGFPRPNPPVNHVLAHPEEVFNPYARFASDYSSCMPGAQFNAAAVDDASAIQNAQAWQHLQAQQQQQPQPGCVPPALLFASSSTAVSPTTSPVTSPTHSHPQQQQQQQQQSQQQQPSPLSKSTTHSPIAPPNPNTPISRHPPTLLLSKPFRCPKPNCNKSYKQANGLKYHMTHGSCNFAPPKDLEHVKDLLERKRRERESQAKDGPGLQRSASLGSVGSSSSSSNPISIPIPIANTEPTTPTHLPGGAPLSPTSILSLTYNDLSNISESDLREVEREAERRLRPFACGVGDCQRRYKNMNGLRYHYQHSGDHGAVGLALLASGQHECLSGASKRSVRHHPSGSGGHGHHGGGTLGGGGGQGGKGSVSVPVSRAGSVSVASSRVGTPQPMPMHHPHHFVGNPHARQNSDGGSTTTTTNGTTTKVLTPTPIQAQAFAVPSTTPISTTPSSATSTAPSSPSSQLQQSQQPSMQPTLYYPTPVSTPSQSQSATTSPSTQQATQATPQQLAAAVAYHQYAQHMQRQYQAVVAAQQAQAQAVAAAQAQAQQQQASPQHSPSPPAQGQQGYLSYDYSQVQQQAQVQQQQQYMGYGLQQTHGDWGQQAQQE